eukprot:366899-Amorphochlora_amoeboformis.AAC.1
MHTYTPISSQRGSFKKPNPPKIGEEDKQSESEADRIYRAESHTRSISLPDAPVSTYFPPRIE